MTKAMRDEVMERLQHLESKTRRLEQTVLILAMLKLGEMLLKMKERFLTSPEGQKKYAEWHLEEYWCLPNWHKKERKERDT